MGQRQRSPKVFFGWWTVIAGGVIDIWAAGFQVYGISALFKPISQSLGITRMQTSIVGSIGRLEGGIEAPITGWLTDKYGPKWILMFSVFLMSLALVLMYYANSLLAYLIIWGVLLGTGHNIYSLPVDTAISNWFVRLRGKALSLRWVLSGLSGVLVLPLIAWLLTVYEWRTVCVIGGVGMALIGFPLAWFLIKPKRPEYYGLLPDGARIREEGTALDQMVDRGRDYAAELEEVEFTARQAMITPAYWINLLVQSVHMLVGPVMSIHTIPFLTDMGIDPLKAAGMMSLMIGVSIPARFIGGYIADRLRIGQLRFLKGAAYFFQAVGIVVFLQYQTISMIFVWFILYGIGQGAGHTINPLIIARYFGRKAYGSIRGSLVMMSTPVGIIAPMYAGWVYDTSGSYISAFYLFGILLVVSAVLACFILPPKPPVQLSGIQKIL
jgi:OFA family oxalate/formate antiporter-like MFS transporter